MMTHFTDENLQVALSVNDCYFITFRLLIFQRWQVHHHNDDVFFGSFHPAKHDFYRLHHQQKCDDANHKSTVPKKKTGISQNTHK